MQSLLARSHHLFNSSNPACLTDQRYHPSLSKSGPKCYWILTPFTGLHCSSQERMEENASQAASPAIRSYGDRGGSSRPRSLWPRGGSVVHAVAPLPLGLRHRTKPWTPPKAERNVRRPSLAATTTPKILFGRSFVLFFKLEFEGKTRGAGGGTQRAWHGRSLPVTGQPFWNQQQ